MENYNLVIQRQIDGHPMYYVGCSMCLEPEWVDSPGAAIMFQDEDVANNTLLRLKAIALHDFPITLVTYQGYR
jgi:hypothetical protein